MVVRQADKGGNIVILDIGLYAKLNLDLLSDRDTYMPLDHDPTILFSAQLKNIINRGFSTGILDKKQSEYIYVSNPIMAVFHSFPKIHKGGFPPPHRPIVAGIGSLNKHLCAWLVPLLSGYLRDTNQVLEALDGRTLDEGSVWITADVTSLYTAIPHNKAIIALEWYLVTYSNYNVELREFIIMATEYLLSHNFFMFNNKYYFQETGASMGDKFSPSMANIYMGWWEHKYLFSDANPLFFSTSWYSRYIDDLLLVTYLAVADVTAVQQFNNYINNTIYGALRDIPNSIFGSLVIFMRG